MIDASMFFYITLLWAKCDVNLGVKRWRSFRVAALWVASLVFRRIPHPQLGSEYLENREYVSLLYLWLKM